MNTEKYRCLSKTRIALAAGAVFASLNAAALDFAQSPPGTVLPYVAPNVIISIDDSGSMGYRLDRSTSGGTNDKIDAPGSNGKWDPAAPRINILKYALKQVFNDIELIPDTKIRLAWQAMWNNGKSGGVGKQHTSGTTSQKGANNVDNGTTTPTIGENTMQILDSDHRQDFLKFVGKLSPNGNTPSHWMMEQADTYMRRPLDKNGPWAAKPGIEAEPYLACRRNYHIMMSDGRWNLNSLDVPDTKYRDNATNLTLDDGTIYGGANTAARKKNALYRDTQTKTLADWAFFSWAKPLQTNGLTGVMKPAADYLEASAEEDFGNDSSGVAAKLDRFWNPRYDPASWPHMVTYTIGFSEDAVTWPGSDIKAPTQKVPFGYDGSFPNLVTGEETWPAMDNENKRALDLWHAALNGRGRFYAVTQAEDLEKAFREIIEQINVQNKPARGFTATSGRNATRKGVGQFIASYDPLQAWRGDLVAEKVSRDGTTEKLWSGKSAADFLDARTGVADRVVLAWQDVDGKGVKFTWNSLSDAQKASLEPALLPTISNDSTDVRGNSLVDYLRGDRAKEGQGTPPNYTDSQPFRQRKSRLGDIVNSDIWYTSGPVSNYSLGGYSAFVSKFAKRTPMLYVGANDGMLHGFSAPDVNQEDGEGDDSGGTERIAYVPQGVLAGMGTLAAPAYAHRYYVDGSPFTGDVKTGPTNTAADWATYLVGTLGAGGKGYFVLDVTDPEQFTAASPDEVVILDRTAPAGATPNCEALANDAKTWCTKIQDHLGGASTMKDVGHIFVAPVLDETNPSRTTQITRMNNDRWAVILGNGYNSDNQRPVLLVQYLDNEKELKLLPATGALTHASCNPAATACGNVTENGLSSPRVVDINGDGRADVVYAGDLKGNLWKFDLTSTSDSLWSVAFNGTPLYVATGPTTAGSETRAVQQPITAAPTVRPNNRGAGGMMVAFGTGRNVTVADRTNTAIQTLYSVLDNTQYDLTSDGQHIKVNAGTCTTPGCTPPPAPAPAGSGVAKLVKQTLSGGAKTGTGASAGREFWSLDDPDDDDSQASKIDWSTQKGWYLDLPEGGERLLKPMGFYAGTNILSVYSQVPSREESDALVESCVPPNTDGERQFLTMLNIMDARRSIVPLLDMNGDGFYNASDQNVSRVTVAAGSLTEIEIAGRQDGYVRSVDNDRQDGVEGLEIRLPPELAVRPSWRQLR